MDSKTKVGFIGFGNMGSAICDGLIKAEAVSTSNIFACANNWDQDRLRLARMPKN